MAVLLGSAAVAVPLSAPATAGTEPLFALEVFEPEAEETSGPLCRDTRRGTQPAPSADLPAGTVPVAVVQGSLRRGAAALERCRFRVRVGAGSVLVYRSAETRVDKVGRLATGVRVVASRDERTGVWLAERVVGRQQARNEVERAFVATVDVVERGLTAWVVTEIGGTGREFTLDVENAEIEVTGDVSPVAVEFDTVAPEPDA